MPGPASDVDIRLHDLLGGAKSGFGANLAHSAWGPAQSDYVLINPNLSWTNFVQWDDASDSLGINSRVAWIIEPGSDLFFVVTHAFDTDGTFTTSSSEIVTKIVWTFRF